MTNNPETGKKCPNCGAEGKWHGEHETAVRNHQIYPAGRDFEPRTIVDVGWRCWKCGNEWGFELPQMLGESGAKGGRSD